MFLERRESSTVTPKLVKEKLRLLFSALYFVKFYKIQISSQRARLHQPHVSIKYKHKMSGKPMSAYSEEQLGVSCESGG